MILNAMITAQSPILTWDVAGALEAVGSLVDLGSTTQSRLHNELGVDERVDISNDNTRGDVEFKGVTFSYHTRVSHHVLKGVSFKVKEGETAVLVGENGSGKSSCIQLLLKFYRPSSGQIVSELSFSRLRFGCTRKI